MSTRTGLAWAIGLPLAAMLWYPDWLAAAAIVGGLALLATVLLAPRAAERDARARRTAKVEPIREIRHHSRWLPGAGVGFSLLSFRPFVWLGLWRWRR